MERKTKLERYAHTDKGQPQQVAPAEATPPVKHACPRIEDEPNPRRWLLRNTDLLMLAALAIVVVGTWLTIELSDAVLDGSAQPYDDRVLAALRSPTDASRPMGPAWCAAMWTDISALGSGSVLSLVTIACAGALLMARRYRMLIVLALVVGGGSLLTLWMQAFFNRPRPPYAEMMPYIVTASFPSGHSMLSAVVYMTLAVLLARATSQRRFKVYFIVVGALTTLLVGVSRVYLGVHYPTDVLAGWWSGLTWAMFCWLIIYFLQQTRLVERPK